MHQTELSRDSDSITWIEMQDDRSLYSSTDNMQNASRFRVAPVRADASPSSQSGEFEDAVSSPVGSFAQRTLGYSNTYDTRNIKSFKHYTRDALPRSEHYRNILSLQGQLCRPTLDELHGGQNTMTVEAGTKEITSPSAGGADGVIRFGWIQGVLIRCLLNIWGVILFIRISWVVAHAGIGLSFVIVILASVVTTITSLSMSAICTNGEVKGGGTYYMISRSLGPEFGGSIGVIFAVANAVAIAMYSVGFAETLQDIFIANNIEITGSRLNDVRLISSIAVCFMLAIALIGTEWESKAQLVLLVILLSALADFLIGCLIPPSDQQKSKGFVGWTAGVLAENFKPDFRQEENFFSVFSVYFPAATGILAGANISGDLKDPQQSIPLGTLLAIFITTLTYLLVCFLTGALVLRDATGLHLLPEVNATYDDIIQTISNCTILPTEVCSYGSHHNNQIIEMIAPFGPLIYAGIFAASLSSALASLVSAPKVFQALCKDRLFPYIEYFALGYGKNNEPRRGYMLAFVVAIGCCIIGDLNLIAPIISNFFLAAYCLINFSCFHASFAKSLGFRPSFKYYNHWVSLMGAVLCVLVMFMTNWPAALVTFLIIYALYLWVMHRKPDVNWGSSTEAQTYRSAIQSVYKLNLLPDHVKNYRPQILVFSGLPSERPPLIDFAYSITKGIGLLVCAHAVPTPLTEKARQSLCSQANHYLVDRKIKAFYASGEDSSYSRVARSMFQSLGMGKLRPNIVLLGYKSNWQTCDVSELCDYFNIIHETFDRHLALGILRVAGGLDFSKYGAVTDIIDCFDEKSGKNFAADSSVSIDNIGDTSSSSNMAASSSKGTSSRDTSPSVSPVLHRRSGGQINFVPTNESCRQEIPKDILLNVNRFQRKQKRGTIDVWWLYDDGGLTMLIPYILSTRSQWRSCTLRVFALANRKDQLDREQRNMAALLNKFRIDYSDVTIVTGIVKAPQQATRQKFSELIAKFRVPEKTSDNDQMGDGLTAGGDPRFSDRITEAEIMALKDKINRHLRLHELLRENSRDASLVVMTLSMPRKGTVSAPMYMAWMEMLTQKMPPFLLLRGNQTNVLTFYS